MHTAKAGRGTSRRRPHGRSEGGGRYLGIATTAVLGWGVLAVGSVFPWGYLPLLAAATAVGLAGLRRRRPAANARIEPRLILSLLVVAAAVGVQLVPLPLGLLQLIGPKRVGLLRALDGPAGPNASPGPGEAGFGGPITVDPGATMLALATGVATGLLLVGTTRALRASGVRRIAGGIAGLGLVVALIGIVQFDVSRDRIYGVWEFPGESPYGPFFNKNHFAGWMLMAIALTLSYLCAVVERAHSDLVARRGGWRQMAWWLTSVEASGFAVLACAVTVMGIALAQTLSTAGILCIVAVVGLLGGRALYRATDWSRRALMAVLLVVPLVVGSLIVGPATIRRGFEETSWADLNSRTPIWDQAIRIAADFPVAGTGINTFQTVVAFYPRADQGRNFDAAHSDYLQLASEGGLLVGMPVLVSLGLLVREIRRRFRDSQDTSTTRWLRVGAVVGLVIIAVQEVIEYSLQVPANAALFAVLVAIAIHNPESSQGWPAGQVRPSRAKAEPPSLDAVQLDTP